MLVFVTFFSSTYSVIYNTQGYWTLSGGKSATHSGNIRYQFVPRVNCTVQIDLISRNGSDPKAGIDPYLYLLDPNNNILAYNDDITSYGDHNSRIISPTLNGGSTYAIVAATFSESETGGFDLTLQGDIQSSSLTKFFPYEDIGSVGRAGSTFFNPTSNSYTLSGSGNDIWNSEDQCHFSYSNYSGDYEIVTFIENISATNSWAKSGLMIRENNNVDSRNVFLALTLSNGIVFQTRSVSGANTISIGYNSNINSNVWLRLKKIGICYYAYYSVGEAGASASKWIELGNFEVNMGTSQNVGLAVTSHDNSSLNTTTFQSVSHGVNVTWKQKEFIVSALIDPSELFNNNTVHDENLLRDFRDCRFSLLMNYRFKTYLENRYVLNRLKNVNNIKMLVSDSRINFRQVFVDYNRGAVRAALHEYQTILSTDDYSIYGYNTGDEPNWQSCINGHVQSKFRDVQFNNSKNKIAYLNLFSNRVSAFLHNNERYREYISSFMDAGAKVIAFDNYCFTIDQNNGNIYIRDRYFENILSFAEETKSRGISFWSHPLSVEHFLSTSNPATPTSPVFIETDGPADYRVFNSNDLTQAQLRFQAYAPVIYGAKGIVWFTYTPPSNQNPSAWWYAPTAIIDADGNPMDGSTQALSPPVFNWVKEINITLRNLGDVLINAEWLVTVHGDQRNNMSGLINGSLSTEENLPIITQSTPIISFISSTANLNNFAIGIFKKGNVYYLMIFNKDLYHEHDLGISLKDVARIYKHGKTLNNWNPIGKNNSIYIPSIARGDIEIFRLNGNDHISTTNLVLF